MNKKSVKYLFASKFLVFLRYFLANNFFHKSKEERKAILKNSTKVNKKVTKPKSIDLENVHKVYSNGIKAIDNQNLKINPGDFAVLLGPSGCGKTTLLRMIAGLENVSDGYIKINDVIVNNIPSQNRDIAMVFQNYALYSFMTVEKNIAFGLKNKTYKNIEYLKKKKEIQMLKNPYFNDIKYKKSEYKLLKGKNPRILDEINRQKRLLASLRLQKNKDSEINEAKEVLEKLKLQIKVSSIDQQKIKKLSELKNDINYLKQKSKNIYYDEIVQKTNLINDLKQKIQDQKNSSLQKRYSDTILSLKKDIDELKQKNKKHFWEKINPEILRLTSEKCEIARKWRNNISKIIQNVTNILGINMYIKRKPSELSGGQRQRVALARAISKETGLFLFDEPLSNLDAKLRAKMRTEIKKLHNLLGATSVYVTHDQIEAMSMADKIVVMNKGYIQQVGTPKELLDSPINLFVAKFIGNTDINIFKVKQTKEYEFDLNGEKIALAKNEERSKKIRSLPRNILMSIRPEHIIVNPQIVSNFKSNKFKGVVKYTELLGNDVLLTVENKKLGNIQILSPLFQNIKLDDEISFVINPNRIHIFDEKTGYNLLTKFSEENEKLKKIWIEGEKERQKNIYLMNKEKNKMTISNLLRNYILSIFSKDIRQKLKERKREIEYGDQLKAY